MLEGIFKLKENKTTLNTEVMAGCTTFMTMAYIIFVNPGILLKDAGIIVGHPVTFVTQGDLFLTPVLLSLAGLAITLFFMSRNFSGALFAGILLTAVLGIPMGVVKIPEQIVSVPSFETVGGFATEIKQAFSLALFPTLFAFMISDFFDTMGTVVGVGKQAGFLDEEGKLPKLRNVLLVDSLGAAVGGAFGASSVTTYIESASGVSQGGRTGLTACVCGLLFLLSLFFSPLVSVVGGGYKLPGGQWLYPVTAPALIVVGFLMTKVLKEIPWDDFNVSIPAFLITLTMPLTFSISHGIGWGFISFTLIKLFKGRISEVHPLMIVISVLFAVSFTPWVPR